MFVYFDSLGVGVLSHFVITHDVEKNAKKVLTFRVLSAIIVKLCETRLNIKHTSLSIEESGKV